MELHQPPQNEVLMPPQPPQQELITPKEESMTIPTPENIQLLVVFDIDETLIQFISKSNIGVFYDAEAELKANKVDYIIDNEQAVLFRPHLKEVFELIKTNNFFVPAIWTYSDQEYANNIAKILTDKYKLPEDFFRFVWSSDHISEDDYAKNLEQVWAKYPEFNKFNTILVDDRYANMAHKANKDNGVFIQAFAPFGTEKVRDPVNMDRFNDTTFSKLQALLEAIKKDITGCEQGDINGAFFKEGVVSKKRLKRMDFGANLKQICVQSQDALFIGEHPHDDVRYKIIGGKLVGGKRKRLTKNKQNRKSKRRNHSKRRN